MTDATSDTQTVRRFDLARVIFVLIRPRQVFGESASETRASWLTPMLVLTVTSLLAVLIGGRIKSQAALLGGGALPPNWQSMTPDMQNNYMQAQQLTQGPVFNYVLPLISAWLTLWIGWIMLAGLLHLGSTLLGGRGSMRGALNVTAWAILPFALRDLLRGAYMLLSTHTIASPSLSGFATGAFMTHVLAHTDLFLLWCAILLVIGFSITDGLSRGKAAIGVVLVLAIMLSVRAGLGAAISGFGSSLQGGFF